MLGRAYQMELVEHRGESRVGSHVKRSHRNVERDTW